MSDASSIAAFTKTLLQATGANVASHAAFSCSVVSEPLHEWKKGVFKRLDELCGLSAGWDGYSAPPVAFSNAHFAASMLIAACPLSAPQPQIVPGFNGDLQIEWHTSTADIELHVKAPYDVEAWRLKHTPSGQEEEELHVERDFKRVAQWIAELSEVRVADQSAAA